MHGKIVAYTAAASSIIHSSGSFCLPSSDPNVHYAYVPKYDKPVMWHEVIGEGCLGYDMVPLITISSVSSTCPLHDSAIKPGLSMRLATQEECLAILHALETNQARFSWLPKDTMRTCLNTQAHA